MTGFFQRNGLVISTYLIVAVVFWVVVMIVLPQAYMLDFSFRDNLPPAKIGGPEDVYTLSNYRYLVFGSPGSADAFNYLHLEVFLRTIIASVFVTLLDFALCYPIAYYIAHVPRRKAGKVGGIASRCGINRGSW
jgi:spermidine/putrescine transport system permease protein